MSDFTYTDEEVNDIRDALNGDLKVASERVLTLELENARLRDVVAAVIDATDKHCRALHFKVTTPENIADLVEAICETDSRHVQQVQAAEAEIARLRAGLEQIVSLRLGCEDLMKTANNSFYDGLMQGHENARILARAALLKTEQP